MNIYRHRTARRSPCRRSLFACAPVLVSILLIHSAPGAWAKETNAEEGKRFTRNRHTVTVDGHPLTVWEKRPATARGAILLVHGRTWSAVPDFDLEVPGEDISLMDALAREGLAVFAVDLRGYGGTTRDQTGWLTPSRAAEDVAGVLAWINAREKLDEKASLLGWSMGSMVAQLCAQRHGAKLSALILYGYPNDPDQRRKERATPDTPRRRDNRADRAAADFITPGAISKEAIAAFVQTAMAADPVLVDMTAMHEYNELDPAKVGVPTLILHGQFDPFAKAAAHAKLFTRLGHPDREWVVLPGGDHAAHMETSAARFVQAVVSFLRRPHTK